MVCHSIWGLRLDRVGGERNLFRLETNRLCVCVCVCVCDRERERYRERDKNRDRVYIYRERYIETVIEQKIHNE